MRDALRDRQSKRKATQLSTEIKLTRMDKIRAMFGKDNSSGKVVLIRRHEHMVQPLRNDQVSRKRIFTHGTINFFFLGACLFTGYAYARLQ